MIVKMKKITLICLAAERESSLEQLRDLGVLHLSHIKTPESADLNKARAELALATTVTNILQAAQKENQTTAPKTSSAVTAHDAVELVNTLSQRKKESSDQLEALKLEKAAIEPFGDFDPSLVRQLAAKGISVKLYHSTDKKPIAPPEGTQLLILRQDSSGQYFALIGKDEFTFDAPPFSLPERSLSIVEAGLNSALANLEQIENELVDASVHLPAILDHSSQLSQKVEFLEAREGMGDAGKLTYLQGFCPSDLVDKVNAAAANNGWGTVIDDPEEGDSVPTLIRYPSWVRMIRPVFAFLGIAPGYKETDISSAFLIFLSIFFAMIVGDAGYGILFLILIPYFRHKKFPNAPPETFRLLYVFSICTTIWGVLTANYLGIDYEMLPRIMQLARIDWLTDQGNSMSLSLFIGAVHLTIAHVWPALKHGRSIKAMVQIGWAGVVWTVFMVARKLLVEAPLPNWFMALPAVSVLLIITGLVMKKQWMDTGLLALDLINCFGDIMSYLRLFALGIASVKVAAAFNGMAGDLGASLVGMFSGWAVVIGVALAAVAMTFVLVLGHGLNIILCAMSVLVHGVRLNALEFSLHIGQEWAGSPYNPFHWRTTRLKTAEV